MKESELQITVAEHLRVRARPNVCWFHPANGEFRDKITGNKLKRMGVRPGIPDLVFIIQGRCIGVELKADKGRQTPAQTAMQIEWIDAGGDYFVARGVDEALEILELIGALKGEAS